MITVTENAKLHIQSMLKKRGKGIGIRLLTKAGGCSGLSYKMDYVDEVEVDDHQFPIDDVYVVLVSPKHWPFVKGTEIDYVTEGLNSGFTYKNPNEKGSCGCGESFAV